jgi:hypothetical protein
LACAVVGALPALCFAATATLTINAGTVVNSFVPMRAFGANAAYWDGTELNTIQPQVLAAGNQFIRYPGGSSSDDFHWNGQGSFDANRHWVPSETSYGLSWEDNELFRGTTSASYSVAGNATDGDPDTYWLSNADTDFPNAQWIYVDLGSAQSATSMQITWAGPYATQFHVQYWNTNAGYPYPYESTSDLWTDTSAGLQTGAGGTQTVTFSATPSSEFYRILCTASSMSPAQYAVAEMSVFNGATQLTVNSPDYSAATGEPLQSNTTASSTDPACEMDTPVDMDFVSFMTWLQTLGPNAKPLITINVGCGTPQEAAAWVYYANVVQGYGIKDWEIGNEMDGDWETGGPLCAVDYARRFIEYYQAMTAVDPTIHVYGPVPGGAYDSSDDLNNDTYIQDFVNRLAADPGGSKTADVGGIDFHWYPNYEDNPPILTTPPEVATFAQTDLPNMLANLPQAATVPVLMTEYNGGINSVGTAQLENGLWVADWLGEFLTNLGSRFSSNLWDLLEADPGDENATAPNGYELGMLNGSQDGWQYQPHAHYWAMQMLTHDWAIPADTNSHSLVQSSTSLPLTLSAYADLRPDGILSLMVINKDPVNAYTTTLDISGFTPNTSAATWTFNASNYAWETTSLPYHAAPDTSPTTGTDSGVASGYTHSFGPYSITVLQFTNSALPPATATMSPTPMPTPTATPTFAPFVLVDNFDNPDRNGAPPARLNLWNGNWSGSASDTTVTVSYLAPGAAGTPYSCSWTSQVGSGGWSDLATSFPSTFDATGSGYVGLEFWAWGDGHTYWASIQTVSVTDYNFYGVSITPAVGQWTFYQIPFTSMARQAGWGTESPPPPAVPVANDLQGLQFATYGSTPANCTLRLDQIGFYMQSDKGDENISTPTFSPSPSFTPSSPTPVAGPSVTILAAQAWPMPLTGKEGMQLGLNLEGTVQVVHVQIYDSTYRLAADLSLPGGGPGWTHVPLPGGVPAANGVYFLRVWAQNGALSGAIHRLKLYVAR